jgi:hypothetical protein
MIAIGVLAALVAALVATSISTAAAPTKVADLFAGQNIDIGDITVGNDPTNLSIQINLTGGWCMTQSHVAVADTAAGIPQSSGNPQPGQFPFSATYSPCATTGSYSIPFTGFTQKFIAVHVTAWDPSSGTTLNIVSDTKTNVTNVNGVAQAPTAALRAYEPVGYTDCGQYKLSPTDGSVWDTHNGGSVSNDAGGPFAGATWIWPTSDPATPNEGEYATFEKGFNLPGPPTSGTIKITADNGYKASLNGTPVGSARLFAPFFATGDLTESGVQSSDWWTPGNFGLAPLQMGTNTLSVIAANEAAYPDPPTVETTGHAGTAGGVCANPAGLIFKAQASYLAKSASGWAGTTKFSGKNWATYFTFTPDQTVPTPEPPQN